MQDNSAQVVPQTPIIINNDKSLLSASDKDLKLASFIEDVIKFGWKKGRIITELESSGINLKYRAFKYKYDDYKLHGLKGILRNKGKDKSDKDTPKAFSTEVIQELTDTFKDMQVGIRTYEEVHKKLRSAAVKFTTSEGDEYQISEGTLFQATDKVAMFTTKFVAGTYIMKDTGEELSIGAYGSAKKYFKYFKDNFSGELHYKKYGKYSYRLKKQHSIKRDYSSLMPNDLWSADNKVLDLLVIDEDWSTVRRFWLSGFLRVPTREYSFELTRSANSESVSNAFVNAAIKWGLPKEINHDRGKDYLSDRTSKMWQGLGIKETVSITKNARAKIIESFHNILDNKLKCKVGYTGNKYEEMPQATREMLKNFTQASKIFKEIDKAVFEPDFKVTLNNNAQGKLKKSKHRFLHISELLVVLKEALAEYDETLHGGLSDDALGKQAYSMLCEDELINRLGENLNTPKGRLQYYQEVGFQPVFAKPEVLSVFAMNNALRTVQISGIEFKGEQYIANRLRRVLGKKVLIKYTNAADNYLYVFTSPEIDKLPNEKALRAANGFDIINQAEFVCVCEKRRTYAYADNTYREQVNEQRKEEKHIRETFKITKVTGMEANVHEIQNQVEEIFHKNTKYKNLKDAFDE